MKCPTTHKKIGEIGGAFGKNDLFSTLSPYFDPSSLTIQTFPPYKIYVFEMRKT